MAMGTCWAAGSWSVNSWGTGTWEDAAAGGASQSNPVFDRGRPIWQRIRYLFRPRSS